MTQSPEPPNLTPEAAQKIKEVFIGGNHLASALGSKADPLAVMNYDDALHRHGQPYADMWVVWKAIINLRDALLANTGESSAHPIPAQEVERVKHAIGKVFVPSGVWNIEEGRKLETAAKAAIAALRQGAPEQPGGCSKHDYWDIDCTECYKGYYAGDCPSGSRIGSTEAEVHGHAGSNPASPAPSITHDLYHALSWLYEVGKVNDSNYGAKTNAATQMAKYEKASSTSGVLFPNEATRNRQFRELTAHLPKVTDGERPWVWSEEDITALRGACFSRFAETIRTESLFAIAMTGIRIYLSRSPMRESGVANTLRSVIDFLKGHEGKHLDDGFDPFAYQRGKLESALTRVEDGEG